jgi:hypothetical protein
MISGSCSRMPWAVAGPTALMLSAGAVVAAQSDERGRPAAYVSLLGTRSETERDPGATTRSAQGPPTNLVIPASHRGLARMTWQKSITFRRQCERIAREPRLTVRVQLFPPSPRAPASTRLLVLSEGVQTADVHVSDATRFVELLAHEIEHVVEWLEGVDLSQAAQRAPHFVWMDAHGAYETRRAIHMGWTVASEVAEAKD